MGNISASRGIYPDFDSRLELGFSLGYCQPRNPAVDVNCPRRDRVLGAGDARHDDQLGEDYMDMAEAKGLPPRRIFLWYGMRNAILPQITAVALAMGFVLSGTVLVEVVFSYPGLGLILFQAIIVRDHFVIQGIALMLILALGFTLLVVDLIYPLIDPRVRFNSS